MCPTSGVWGVRAPGHPCAAISGPGGGGHCIVTWGATVIVLLASRHWTPALRIPGNIEMRDRAGGNWSVYKLEQATDSPVTSSACIFAHYQNPAASCVSPVSINTRVLSIYCVWVFVICCYFIKITPCITVHWHCNCYMMFCKTVTFENEGVINSNCWWVDGETLYNYSK